MLHLPSPQSPTSTILDVVKKPHWQQLLRQGLQHKNHNSETRTHQLSSAQPKFILKRYSTLSSSLIITLWTNRRHSKSLEPLETYKCQPVISWWVYVYCWIIRFSSYVISCLKKRYYPAQLLYCASKYSVHLWSSYKLNMEASYRDRKISLGTDNSPLYF